MARARRGVAGREGLDQQRVENPRVGTADR
jgi:hypothetical protein